MNWTLMCCIIISISSLTVAAFMYSLLKRQQTLNAHKDEEIAYLRITVNYLKDRK